jgi:predicted PurR-regulated permease PerM
MSKPSNDSRHVIKQSIDIYVTLIFITLLAYVSFMFISPFISVLLWAVIFSVSLYPLFMKLTHWLGGREKLTAILMAVFSLVFFLAPMVFIAFSAIESAAHLAQDLRNGMIEIPPPHESIKSWPLIGEKMFTIWSDALVNLQATVTQYLPQIKIAAAEIVNIGASIMGGILQFTLAIIFACAFFIYAKPLGGKIHALEKRLDGNANTSFVTMAISTTRSVFRGIIGVAAIQGGLASIGFFVAGLPLAGLWAMGAFAASVIQFPVLVILPSLIYVWVVKSTVVALSFTVYMAPIMLIDNILKPILMTKGLRTPMIVIFIGVIGGTLSLGILGLFIGPVILAVFYEMVVLWVRQREA